MDVDEAEAFILESLPLTGIPALPGLRLHLAGPRSRLGRLARINPDFNSPYWAHLWGGGLALALYLRERPEAVAGRRVLDLGSGSGVVAIAAAQAGAAAVTAVDVDPFAAASVRLNAAANGAAVTALQADLTEGDPPPVDVLLVSDLFYDPGLVPRLTAFLDRCLAAGVEVLVGDPWRKPLPLARLKLLAEYDVPDFGGRHPGPAAVFAFVAG